MLLWCVRTAFFAALRTLEPFTDKLSFRVLSKLANACCVIPVSNADPERIVSMLKKTQTDIEVRSEQ
jgi:hypothetical protein